jgi:hypothetical protein
MEIDSIVDIIERCGRMWGSAMPELDRLRAENERLRRHNDMLLESMKKYVKQADHYEARLKPIEEVWECWVKESWEFELPWTDQYARLLRIREAIKNCMEGE